MPKLVQQSVTLPAPPERLYDMYVDPLLHAEFTGAPVTIGSTPGAEFRAFGDMLSGRIDLMHVNVADHDVEGVSEGWKKYYWDPWRAYLSKGS